MQIEVIFLSVLLLSVFPSSKSTEFESDEANDDVECGVTYNLGNLMVENFTRYEHPW